MKYLTEDRVEYLLKSKMMSLNFSETSPQESLFEDKLNFYPLIVITATADHHEI